MTVICSAPGLDHVHWVGRPGERFILEDACVASDFGYIRSDTGTDRLSRLSDLHLCGPETGDPLGAVSEQEALEEMLADLEEEADPDTMPLREELGSRLAHIAA
ncbi:hypothetical protein [Streptosporangium sp. NPDC050280]|uniref:hypothetical protein n=1 Tax=unclassified Streptosporangium TaxID=2632669 RepID=UPI00344014CA